MSVPVSLSEPSPEVARVAGAASCALCDGHDTALYPSRALVAGAAASLAVGRRISEGLVAIVHASDVRPRCPVAKGGMTLSDVATAGLGVWRALGRGQILSGVPLWRPGIESHNPGLTCIVFPGNIGASSALAGLVAALKRMTGVGVCRSGHVSRLPALLAEGRRARSK